MRKVTFLSIYVAILTFGFIAWSFWPNEEGSIEPPPTIQHDMPPAPSPIPDAETEKQPPLETVETLIDPMLENEITALASAELFLDTHDFSAYTNLRQQWKGREIELGNWLFTDARALLLAGRREAAITLLDSLPLTGSEETERLVQLAALNVVEHPQKAWGYLVEASVKDPNNADLKIFKASLLESVNKHEMALKEYMGAIEKSPNNPYLQEQLADFYLRTERYPQALEVLHEALQKAPLDTTWLKALFWSSVAAPLDIPWPSQSIPAGQLKPLIEYLQSLPSGTFWNETAFTRLASNENYLTQRQETFWLRLLEELKNRKEKEALQLINENPFQETSWAPHLEKSLKTILTYRLYQPQTENFQADKTSSSPLSPQQLFDILATQNNHVENVHFSSDIDHLLKSDEIFAAAFLANGWNEAAIQLHVLPIIPSQFPTWIAYGLAKALQQNRGDKPALAFAKEQIATPEITLLLAQMALKDGKRQEGFNLLLNIYKNKDSIGSQAALLIAPLFLEQSNTKDGKEALLMHASLANDIKAREILARIFIKEGENETAYRLYQSIEGYSPEAKSFLARKAFMDRDWRQAKLLTEELLEIHPENQVLQENLKRIITELNRG